MMTFTNSVKSEEVDIKDSYLFQSITWNNDYRKKYIDKLKYNDKRVKQLNMEIVRLEEERMMILQDSYFSTRNLICTYPFSCEACDEIYRDFKKVGFESQRVKELVKTIRLMCFDDSLPEFQAYNCIDFNYGHYNDHVASFKFSNGKLTFVLVFPFNVPSRYGEDYGSNEYLGGRIQIRFRPQRCFDNEYFESWDYNEIKKSLTDFVKLEKYPDQHFRDEYWENVRKMTLPYLEEQLHEMFKVNVFDDLLMRETEKCRIAYKKAVKDQHKDSLFVEDF